MNNPAIIDPPAQAVITKRLTRVGGRFLFHQLSLVSDRGLCSGIGESDERGSSILAGLFTFNLLSLHPLPSVVIYLMANTGGM